MSGLWTPGAWAPPAPQAHRWKRRPAGDQVVAQLTALGATSISFWQRDLDDGHLSVLVAHEPPGWHLSISHRTNDTPPRPGRIPTWEEIRDARYDLLPDELTVAMLLPPRAEYVNHHPTTMHLHEVVA